MKTTHARQERLDNHVHADPTYGSAEYFRRIDAGAPKVDRAVFRRGSLRTVPFISRLYPVGYYALVAVAIGVGDAVTHGSVVGQFIFARFLSVFLLIPTLIFTWLSLRELAIGRNRSLLILACVAFFPMTAWMFGSVQPDDLVCALIAPIVFIALRLRRASLNEKSLAAVGILLGALMATKHHYFAAVFVPVAVMLAVRIPFRRYPFAAARAVGWIMIPPLVAYVLTEPMLRPAPGGGGVCRGVSPFMLAQHYGPDAVLHLLLSGFQLAITNMFFYSDGLQSFWLTYTAYRTQSLIVVNESVTAGLMILLPALTLGVSILFIARMLQVAKKVLFVARRRSLLSAAKMATSNVLVNAYLCLFVVLCGFEMYVGGYIPLQGRYWLPLISAIWLVAANIAPRALPRRLANALGKRLLVLILGFDLVASAFAFPSIHGRFYGPSTKVAPTEEVEAWVTTVTRSQSIDIRGAAIDLRRATPVDQIVIRLDDSRSITARAVDRPDVLCGYEKTLLRTGFEAGVKASTLSVGQHTLVVLVKTPWSERLVDSGVRKSFDVVSRPRGTAQ